MAEPPDPSIGQRLIVSSIWMVVWRSFSRALGVINTLVLARLLVPADFGLVAMAAAFVGAVESLSQIGLYEALIRARGDDRSLLDTGFTMQLIRGVLTAALLALTAPLAAAWFDEPRLIPIVLTLALATAMGGCENIGIVEFAREMRAREQVRLAVMPRIASFAAGLAAAFVLRSYWALPFAVIVGATVRLVMTYVQHPYRPRLTLGRWRDLVGFSLWTWATSLVRLIWNRMDAFVLGPVFGARGIGVYFLSVELGTLAVTEVVEPIVKVLYPAMAAARKEGTSLARLIPEVAAILAMAVIPLTLAISASAHSVVRVLLGPQWPEAGSLVVVLAATCVPTSLSYVGMTALVVAGRVRQDFQVMVAAMLLRGGLLYLTATSHDLRLVAMGTFAAMLCEAALFTLQVRRAEAIDFGAASGTFGRMAVAGGATAALLLLSGLGWNGGPDGTPAALTHVAGVGLLSCGSFFGLLLLLWRLAGRPGGAERRGLDLLDRFLRKRGGIAGRFAIGLARVAGLRQP